MVRGSCLRHATVGKRIAIQAQATWASSQLFSTSSLWLVVLGHVHSSLFWGSWGWILHPYSWQSGKRAWPPSPLLVSPVPCCSSFLGVSLCSTTSGHLGALWVSEFQCLLLPHGKHVSLECPFSWLSVSEYRSLGMEGETPTFHLVGIPGPSLCRSHLVE